MGWVTNLFKELDPDDYREFVVTIFGLLGYAYLFAVTFFPIPEANQDIRTAGVTLVSTVIFGRMIVEFVNGKSRKKDTKEIIE